jgi:hypothetical protein
MRPIAHVIALSVVLLIVSGCGGRFAGVADDLARVRPQNLSGDKTAIESLLDDAFRGFNGADAQQVARSAGDEAFKAAAGADALARRFPIVHEKVASAIRGTVCDIGRHYLTSDEDPDVVETLANNGIAEVLPPAQIAMIATEVEKLGADYKRGVSLDRIYWSARIGIECLLAGKSR